MLVWLVFPMFYMFILIEFLRNSCQSGKEWDVASLLRKTITYEIYL